MVEQAVDEVLLHTLAIRLILDSYTASALARQAARTVGLDAAGEGSAAIVAGELSTNIARHAGAGRLRLYGSSAYLKIVAEDRGPGIQNVETAIADRHSGGRRIGPDDPRHQGIGCGLGAVRRLSHRFRIESEPGAGTRVVAVRFRTRGKGA